MSQKIQSRLDKIAMFFEGQRHIDAIKKGIMVTIPATIVGGILLILANPPIAADAQPTNFFIQFMLSWKEWATANAATINAPQILTLGAIALYATIGISYNLANYYKINPLTSAVNAAIVFLVIAAPAGPVHADVKGAFMSTGFLDGKGIFTAILVGLLTVEIARFLIKNNIKIKLPETVPPMVSAPFEALIPLMLQLIIFYGINLLLVNNFGMSIPAAIMQLMRPLVVAVDSYFGILLVVILINLFWWFGLHGGAIVGAITGPFLASNFAANAQAYQAGTALTELPHIFAGSFTMAFANIGGFAATMALTILLATRAKSAHLKSIGRLAIGPQIFNINEPVTFGVPLMFNTTMVIPIFLVPFLNVTISYWSMKLGLINRVVVQAPWTTPGPILAFVSTLDWKAVVLWFGLLALDLAVYFPFFKKMDDQKVLEEHNPTTEKQVQ